MSEWTERNQHDSEIYTQGYNDGYDACEIDNSKYRWHDLRKNPNDLPSIEPYRQIEFCVGGFYFVNSITNFYEIHEDIDAWREIEPFEVTE